MGHQAANCKTGTIKWREVFGNEAFIVRKPVFMTDMLQKRAERKTDHDKLTADAIAYAKSRCASTGLSYSVIEQVAAKSQVIDTDALLQEKRAALQAEEEARHKRRKETPVEAVAAVTTAAPAPAAADAASDLPPGWAVAYVRTVAYFFACSLLVSLTKAVYAVATSANSCLNMLVYRSIV